MSWFGISKIPTPKERLKIRMLILIATASIFSVAVLAELNLVNGPWYWKWYWRDLNPFRTALILMLPLVPLSYVLLCIVRGDCSSKVRMLLLLMVLANFSMQVLGMLADPRGYSFVREIVISPRTTSYFTDAEKIRNVSEWLARFHFAKLELHSSTHPPGPVLFYYFWIKLLGSKQAAYVGAHVIGLVGSLNILAFYYFTGFWTADVRSRLISCIYFSLLPALVLFFPEFDQIYPGFTILLIAFWITAIHRSCKYSVFHGMVVSVSLFFTYSLLLIGPFLVLYGVYFLSRNHWKARNWSHLLRAGAISTAVCLLCYLLMRMITGFRPILSLQHAMATQKSLAATQGRPYFHCIAFDLYDFALGAGILVLPLLAFYLLEMRKHFSWDRSSYVMSLIGFATILIVDLSGLLRVETARVWMFLQPLLVLPVTLPLREFGTGSLSVFFLLLWFIVVLIKSKMLFIYV